MNIHDKLLRPFERIHWRQGPGGTQLAYVDSRDVQNRLDDVVGPFGWQSYFDEMPSGRVICRLSILNPETGEWITKSDGAGDTTIEGAKGAISEAFKRAAVMFGIGRYLYYFPTNGQVPAWADPDEWDKRHAKD